MPAKIHVDRIRLWLAGVIAPADAHVHDPDDTACPHEQVILEAAFDSPIGDNFKIDLRYEVLDVADAGWLEWSEPEGRKPGYTLTASGEKQLARRWGPYRIPPWSGGYYSCAEHGIYDAAPGDLAGCPECRRKTVLGNTPWWSRMWPSRAGM